MSPPIISSYKRRFAVKRIIQTFLGGPKVVSSVWIITLQAFIYVIPAVIVCVVNFVDSSLERWEGKALLTGVGIFLTDITLTFLIWILKQRRDANINPEHSDEESDSPENSTSATLFDEEETVPGDGYLKSSTMRFIAGNVNMTLVHFFALFCSSVSTLLCVSVIADESVHPVLKGFVIFSICNVRYSAVINAPPEVATFDPVNRRHVFYRSFYTSLVASINFVIMSVKSDGIEPVEGVENARAFTDDTSSTSTFFGIVLSTLPLVWLTGILPPLDALFPWLFEMILEMFGSKSIGYTYFGTTISLGFALVGPLATFILTQEPKITFLLECLCGYLLSCDTGSMPKLKASLCEEIPTKYFLRQLIKPAVTILCSLVSVMIVETSLMHTSTIPEREIYHPVLASISIFLLLTTKLVQVFDVVHRKCLSSRLCLSLFSMWHGLLTIVLHIWITFELTTEHIEESLKKSLDDVVHSLQQLLPCILSIRSFALAVTEPHNSTINILVSYIYQMYFTRTDERPLKFVAILFVVSVIQAVIKRFFQYVRMVVIFFYATFSSTLVERKYAAGAALLSAPLSFLSLIMTSLVKGMSLVPMFTLPIFTIGFPRPQSFWKGIWFMGSCGHNETQRIMPVTSSVDWTIYADVAPFLVHALAKRSEDTKIDLEPGSCYIARYDDRLLFIRILSSGWKFLYAQVKGLEIQEQTSCHHQEAAWLDEMFEKYIHSCNSAFRRFYTFPLCIINSLEPKFSLTVPSYSESKSQLPNFLGPTGKLIFRDMFFRAFSFLWIKGNPAFQGESYKRHIASGVPLGKHPYSRMHPQTHLFERSQITRNGNLSTGSVHDDRNSMPLGSIGPDMNGNRAHSLLKDTQQRISSSNSSNGVFPRGTSAPMMQPRHHPPLRDVSATNWQGSMSYPLIPGLPNSTIEDTEIESLSLTHSSTNDIAETQEITDVTISPPSGLLQKSEFAASGLPQLWMKQCAGDAIPYNAVKARVEKLCWKAWELAFGTHDDLYEVDVARFYRREFAKNLRAAMVHEKPDFEEIAVMAFRYATKLTLDEMYANVMDIDESMTKSMPASRRGSEMPPLSTVVRCEEDEKGIFLQLSTFEKSFKFCAYDEIPYWMNDKVKHIVAISADGDKNILRIFNYQSEGVEFSVGELSRHCVEGIWSSLSTELLYLTSDDDERYSIQNDKYLLRNLCAQSAPTLGYPVYEATYRVNLFDFSLEQVSN